MENTKSIKEMTTKELDFESKLTELRIRRLEKTGAPEEIIKEEKKYWHFLRVLYSIQHSIERLEVMAQEQNRRNKSCKNK